MCVVQVVQLVVDVHGVETPIWARPSARQAVAYPVKVPNSRTRLGATMRETEAKSRPCSSSQSICGFTVWVHVARRSAANPSGSEEDHSVA